MGRRRTVHFNVLAVLSYERCRAARDQWPETKNSHLPCSPTFCQQSSDLAKAIEYLYGKGYEVFDVVGIEGGLESHQLGIWGALAEAPGDVGITLHSDRSEIHRISPKLGETLVEVPIGSEFSVFALENCNSVTVIGGKWGLNGESLRLSTRGLHNIAEASTLSFSSDGVLVAIINR